MRRWIAGTTLPALALGATVFATAASGAATAATAEPGVSVARQAIARQLVALQQLRDLVEQHPDRYAGLSSHGPDQVTIHLVGDRSAAAATELPEIQRVAASAEVEVSVDHKRYSLRELNQVMESISLQGPFAAGDAGLSRWGINPDTNTVEVGVLDVTPGLLARAKEAYGDKVTVTRQPRITNMSGRRTDTPPFYGGDMLDVRPPGGNYCSSGFTLTNLYGTRYAITAGHCAELGQRVETNNRSLFGIVYFRRYGSGNLDNELVGGVGYGGRIWVGGPNTTTSLPVHSARDSCTGCYVNFDGSFTGEAGVRLVGSPFCAYDDRNAYSCGLQEAVSVTGGTACQPGDSGGPVFAHDGQGGVIAVGIIKGGYSSTDCVYTQLPPILSSWQSTITTG